jgi:cytochrome oxidase assembly protein ShyY1
VHARKEKFAFFKSVVALTLVIGCLWASQWQYHRGQDRHDRNFKIEANTTQAPAQLSELESDVTTNEWRPVMTSGVFDSSNQILLRNRYFEGKYGFAVLTRFTTSDGDSFWIDRGWVQAGIDATIVPKTSPLPSGVVDVVGRLRLDSSLPVGSFFALPSSADGGLVSKLNAQSGLASENYYLDLISGSEPELTPVVAAQIPELSDGPHLAYAVQWVIFGGLVVYGRFLIRKIDRAEAEIKINL